MKAIGGYSCSEITNRVVANDFIDRKSLTMLNSLNTESIMSQISQSDTSDPSQYIGFGSIWHPRRPIAYAFLLKNDPVGLYVRVNRNFIEVFTGSMPKDITYVFRNSYFPDPKTLQFWVNKFPENSPESVKWFMTYLNYTYECLNYIYATSAGKALLDALRQSNKKVFIPPKIAGHNQTISGSTMCLIAELATDSFKALPAKRGELKRMLRNASKLENLNDQLQWLANKVNKMPLYSLFREPKYPDGFFKGYSRGAVTSGELKKWLKKGNQSPLVIRLDKRKEEGVNFLIFFNLAVIISLYDHSPPGTGMGSNVEFVVSDSAKNRERPPAIGLAHELIHAYYNTLGRQPGVDSEKFTTTLYEILCVGVGPWSNNPISENKIRASWPPGNIPKTDEYNFKKVKPRLVYDKKGFMEAINERKDKGPI